LHDSSEMSETDYMIPNNTQVTPEEMETILMLSRKMEGGEPESASSPEQELQEGMCNLK
jgi:hypothetical protein